MNKNIGRYDHLIKNLERIVSKDSIFENESGQKAFLSLGQGNVSKWLETLLPNTKLIIEPDIIGSSIGIQYINGKLNKAINKNSEDITKQVKSLRCIPKAIAIKKRIEIRGVIYHHRKLSSKDNKIKIIGIKNATTINNEPKFCAFQILHCKINHFQSLLELKNLNFEIPQTQFTNYVSDVDIYRQCWKEGMLFQSYPMCGIVLKINSKKLQKYLGENNLSVNWAYAIN